MRSRLLIVGAGGFAREAFEWIKDQDLYEPVAFYSDQPMPNLVLPSVVGEQALLLFMKQHAGLHFFVAVGDPGTRSGLRQRFEDLGLIESEPIIHPTAVIGGELRIGRGSIVCPNTILTTNIEIGWGVIINIGCTIGHDCEIDNDVTISPGANISGNTYIGAGSYVGTGACTREKVYLGPRSVLGMGAVLTKDLPLGQTWVGNPAKPLIRER